MNIIKHKIFITFITNQTMNKNMNYEEKIKKSERKKKGEKCLSSMRI